MKDDFVSTFASNEKVIINQAMLHDEQISRIEVWDEKHEFIFLRMDCPDLESVRSVLKHIKNTFPNAGETDWVLNNSVFTNRLIFTPFFRWYDLWVGVYIDRHNETVYICPLPMVGISINYSGLRLGRRK